MYVSAVLSLCCCPQAFSSCSKQGPLFVEVHGLLTAVASLAVDYRLQAHRLSAGGSRAPSAGSAAVPPRLRVVAPGLRVRAQQLWCRGLVAPRHVGSSLDQGSNLCLLHWQVDSSSLEHQGSLCLSFFSRN